MGVKSEYDSSKAEVTTGICSVFSPATFSTYG